MPEKMTGNEREEIYLPSADILAQTYVNNWDEIMLQADKI